MGDKTTKEANERENVIQTIRPSTPKSPVPPVSPVSKYQVPRVAEKRELSIGCRISWREKRLLDILMREAKDKLPWKTESDFHYWCFLRGMKEVSEDIKADRFTNLYKQISQGIEMLKEAEERRNILDFLNLVKLEVKLRDDLKAPEQVPPLLRKVERTLLEMQSSYWVERAKKEFYRDFGERLKEGRISARPRDAEKGDEDE
jgi:hypothetical protein